VNGVVYQYNTQTAEGFDAIYALGHDAATEVYRVGILSREPTVYKAPAKADADSLLAAQEYREERQAIVPNFTDDNVRFDAAWAAGFVVATIAEQDAFLCDPEGYCAELQKRYVLRLPSAQVIDAEPDSA